MVHMFTMLRDVRKLWLMRDLGNLCTPCCHCAHRQRLCCAMTAVSVPMRTP